MDFSSLCAPRVAEERKRLGLSQDMAGSLCGVSREMWGKYERGKGAMGAEVMAAFAQAGGDVLYILTGMRGENIASTPTELAYLRNCRALARHGLAQKGLDGLTFLRQASGIELEERSAGDDTA